MTDTTDLKALPKITLEDLLIRCTDYDDMSLSMDASELKMLKQHISLLEAERQRAAGSEEELHKALHREKAAGRKLLAAQEEIAALKGEQVPVALTVWYGSMPESNGKENWTAILHRKGEGKLDGITIDRSEYPGRVLYAADRARYLIGEKQDRPHILSYDSDKRSNYI